MDLLSYLEQLPKGGKTEFAKKIDVTKPFLRNMAIGKAKIPIYIAKRIEKQTFGKVSKTELRPDVWDCDAN